MGGYPGEYRLNIVMMQKSPLKRPQAIYRYISDRPSATAGMMQIMIAAIAEALLASSTTKVRFATEEDCRVAAGRWISAFTGNVIQNASDLDIDHVVPLAWSWPRGAHAWSNERRLQFANDPVNLLPVEASLNRSKGAKGPNEWLPPAGQCGYVARFVRVLRLYDLKPSPHEMAWFKTFLKYCR